MACPSNFWTSSREQAIDQAHPDTEPDQLMTASDEVRLAWANAPVITRKLNFLARVLTDAAELAGVKFLKLRVSGEIGLTVNAEGLHRRRVWEACPEASGRGGRWHALHKLGATIEAADLDDYKPYSEPAELEIKQVQSDFGTRQEPHDPEDDVYRRV